MKDSFFDKEDIIEPTSETGSFFDQEDIVQEEPELEEPEKVSKTEALAQGAGQGVTLGTGDELGAMAYTAFDKLKGLLGGDSVTSVSEELAEQGFKGDVGPTSAGEMYKETRDELRQDLSEAEKQQSGAFLAGEVLGGTTLPVGQLSAIKKLETLAKASKLGRAAKGVKGVGTGLRQGVGLAPQAILEGSAYATGKAEELEDIPGDVAKAATLSGGIAGVLPAGAEAAVKAVSKGTEAGVKGLTKLSSGMNTQQIDDFFSNPMKYVSNQFRKDTVSELESKVDDLANNARDFSRQARETLSEEADIPTERIMKDVEETIRGLKGVDAQAVKEVDNFRQQVGKDFGDTMSQKDIQAMLDDLAKRASYSKKNATPAEGVFKGIRAKYAKELRDMSPEYGNLMDESAKRFQTLSKVADEFKIEDKMIKEFDEFGDVVDTGMSTKFKRGDTVGNKLKSLTDEDKGSVLDLLNEPDVQTYLKANPEELQELITSREFNKALDSKEYNIRAMTTLKSLLGAAGIASLSGNPLVGAAVATAASAPFLSKAILKNPEKVARVKDMFRRGSNVLGKADAKTKNILTTSAGVLGAEKVEADKLQNRKNVLFSAQPEDLNDLADVLQEQGKSGNEFARVLRRAAENEEIRSSALYGLYDQPAFRQLLKQLDTDEEK